jgi:hypothetical protein
MDKQIEWLCKNVPAFEPAYLQAEKARRETEENRRRMAQAIRAREKLDDSIAM